MDHNGPRPGVELPAMFGEIDIYLFDQLLRGRFDERPRVLDAGAGSCSTRSRRPTSSSSVA